MKVLICGDSYCVTDPAYPGLHWSEKILDCSADIEVINLAYGGCSNALVTMQLLSGLRFKPDFVVFSFTSDARYEFDRDKKSCPVNFSPDEIAAYIKNRYQTNNYTLTSQQETALASWLTESSESFERIKNYFFVLLCLTLTKTQQIPFCYSLGGFAYQQDYVGFLNQHFVQNILAEFDQYQLRTNLWYYGDWQTNSPCFHVEDESVQQLFANECVQHVRR